MKIKTYLFLSILAISSIFVLGSCDVENSADVKQDKIYAIYEAFYNSNSDKTWVVARFRFGGPTGTLLQLEDPASVTFEGDTLPWAPLFFGHFKEYAGHVTSGTFSYTNVDLDVFNNDLQASEAIAFPAAFDSLPKSSATSLVWDGTMLGPDQRVALFIGSWTWGQDALALQTTEGSDNIILGVDQMANVPLGNAICYMDRTTEVTVAEGTSEGGVVRATYRANNRNILVVE